MAQSQLLKGVLEGVVLALIKPQPVYGYQLMQQLHAAGFETVNGGTLYPLLAKLEQAGKLVGSMRPSPDGPDRKYFELTKEGEQALVEWRLDWAKLIGRVSEVLEEER